jgi:hypothetical protein
VDGTDLGDSSVLNLKSLGDLGIDKVIVSDNGNEAEGIYDLDIASGIDLSGSASEQSQAIDSLLALFDNNGDGDISGTERLFTEAAGTPDVKVVMAVNTDELALSQDQIQDLLNLGVDSLVSSTQVNVDLLGKSGDINDIFKA